MSRAIGRRGGAGRRGRGIKRSRGRKMDGGAAEEFADSQAGALRDLGTSGLGPLLPDGGSSPLCALAERLALF